MGLLGEVVEHVAAVNQEIEAEGHAWVLECHLKRVEEGGVQGRKAGRPI